MHPIESVLARFEHILDEEKFAIERIESDRLVAIAGEKESLTHALLASDFTEHQQLVERFVALTTRIRSNMVLLAHARACLRDVVETLSVPAATYTPGPRVAVQGVGCQLSKTG